MKIITNTDKNIDASIAFESITEALFHHFNLNIEEYHPERIVTVSLDGAPGGDITFDYDLFCQGPVGQKVVIKNTAVSLFGKEVDPRPVQGKVVQGILDKKAAKAANLAPAAPLASKGKPSSSALPISGGKVKENFSAEVISPEVEDKNSVSETVDANIKAELYSFKSPI
jgi:hypothetical protein